MAIKTVDDFLDLVERIPESGCWIWMGGLDKLHGYGYLCSNGKTFRAHRYSYSTFVGEIPRGLLVCHRCDVRCCVNPNHLFVGTTLDNMADMARKERSVWKLNRSQVVDARARLASGETQAAVAASFGISQTAVSAMRKGGRRHLPEGLQEMKDAIERRKAERRAVWDERHKPKPLRPRGGENSQASKLTFSQIEEIKRLYVPYDKDLSGAALGRRFGVSRMEINHIVRGNRWNTDNYKNQESICLIQIAGNIIAPDSLENHISDGIAAGEPHRVNALQGAQSAI